MTLIDHSQYEGPDNLETFARIEAHESIEDPRELIEENFVDESLEVRELISAQFEASREDFLTRDFDE